MVYGFLENSRSLGCVGSLPQVLAGGVNRSNDGHPPKSAEEGVRSASSRHEAMSGDVRS